LHLDEADRPLAMANFAPAAKRRSHCIAWVWPRHTAHVAEKTLGAVVAGERADQILGADIGHAPASDVGRPL